MESRTKTKWTKGRILSLLTEPWSSYPVSRVCELGDGCFNASYRIEFKNKAPVILKVGPVQEVELLSYEERMMETEIAVLNSCADLSLPMPRLLYSDTSCRRVPAPYSIFECLSGVPLNKLDLPLDSKRTVYLALARTMATLHRLKGNHFGYRIWQKELVGKSYEESFRYMVSKVISDGLKRGSEFPVSVDSLMDLIDTRKMVFEDVSEPTLVHFDLWEGNIFARKNRDSYSLEAIIDFERAFWADPAVDMTQVDLVFDLHEESWFLDEYNRFAEVPVYWDDKTCTRVCLFKLYLFLIMIVESDYRDLEGSFIDQRKWSTEQFMQVYQQLIDY